MPLVIIWSQHSFEAPQVGETRCLAPASRIEVRAVVRLGVHRGAFREQKLRSRNAAVECRLVQRRFASGGFSRKAVSGGRRRRGRCAGETTKVVGMRSSRPVQTTIHDECFGLQAKIHLQTFKASFLQHYISSARILTCYIVIIDPNTEFPNSPHFWKLMILPNIYLNADSFFFEFQAPKTSEVVQVGDSQNISSLLRTLASCIIIALWSSIMIIDFSKSSKCPKFDTKYIHKQFANTLNKFQYILFPTNYLQRNDVYNLYTLSWCLYGILHYYHSLTCHLWSSDPNILLKRPKSARLDFLAPASRIEVRAAVFRGVHGGAFGEQQLCSRDVVVVRRLVQRRFASGAFSRKAVWPLWLPADGAEADAPWEDDESGGHAELYTRSNDNRMMNVWDSKSSKLFRFTNTLDKFQCIFFTTSLLMKKMQY